MKELMVRDLPDMERPREKLLLKGAQSLSDAELLAILLRTGTKEDSVIRVAEKLLSVYKNESLGEFANLSVNDFSKIKGIGKVKAITVLAALELGKRLAEAPSIERKKITSPQDVVNYFMPRFRYEKKEHFIVVLLDTKNHILATPVISVGCLNSSIVHPREVFREAIVHFAAAMILVHNHPSGDPTPSKEDIHVTHKLIEAGGLMDIKVIDHIIIGDNCYISLKEERVID
ncbi:MULTISPECIES: RadC family protein [Anaerosinus]|uniref:DNA repair protein RadC n=1 Tax=Selenobaculum gibii TaxID=3054208 RepID=A0A9Y2AKT0_9FIRM|nr:DNA repair protein RadC [Selenobaculum gbiensis]WIW71400.1 DNA repair protein RadC [Selenobaculum gbiensis]